MRPTATFELEGEGEPRFGDFREARITLLNSTFDAILIRSVELEGQLLSHVERLSALAGDLRQETTFQRYTYNPDAPGATPPLFLMEGLLLPGETRLVHHWVRMRFFRQNIEIHFQRIPTPELLHHVYFPDKDPHRKNRTRFRRLVQSELMRYRQGEAGTLDRVVIIPNEERWPLETSLVTVNVPIRDPETPANLISQSGATASAKVNRWRRENLWIVDDAAKEETFALNSEGTKLSLPRCDLRVFDVLDLRLDNQPVDIYYSDGSMARSLGSDKIPALLEDAKRHSMKLSVHSTETETGGYAHGIVVRSLSEALEE